MCGAGQPFCCIHSCHRLYNPAPGRHTSAGTPVPPPAPGPAGAACGGGSASARPTAAASSPLQPGPAPALSCCTCGSKRRQQQGEQGCVEWVAGRSMLCGARSAHASLPALLMALAMHAYNCMHTAREHGEHLSLASPTTHWSASMACPADVARGAMSSPKHTHTQQQAAASSPPSSGLHSWPGGAKAHNSRPAPARNAMQHT